MHNFIPTVTYICAGVISPISSHRRLCTSSKRSVVDLGKTCAFALLPEA